MFCFQYDVIFSFNLHLNYPRICTLSALFIEVLNIIIIVILKIPVCYFRYLCHIFVCFCCPFLLLIVFLLPF